MYFPGYLEPAKVNPTWVGSQSAVHGENIPETARCGDDRVHLTHDMQVARAEAATAEPELADQLGCKGYSQPIRMLSYLNYNDFFPLPIAHMCLHGVVARFWGFCLGELGKKAKDYSIRGPLRAVMTKRAAHISVTNDFNRPYRDIVKRHGRYTMEEWLRWCDVHSVYILHPHKDVATGVRSNIMPVVCRTVGNVTRTYDLGGMWGSLRRVVLHYFRYEPSDFTREACDEVHEELLTFCKSAEAVFGVQFCTYNLHALRCQARRQEKRRGHLSFSSEWWVERGVQEVKSSTKFRSTLYPELLFASEHVARTALTSMRYANRDACRTFNEWVPEYFSANVTLRSALTDDEDAEGNQLLGGGYVHANRLEVIRALEATTDFEDMLERNNIVASRFDECQVQKFKRALKRRDEVLLSKEYGRAQRESYYILVRYADTAGVWVGEVLYYAKVIPPQGNTLRLAICNLHVAKEVSPGFFRVQKFDEREASAAERNAQVLLNSYPVELKTVDHKVMRCSAGQGTAYFLKYTTFSQMPVDAAMELDD